MAGNPKHVLVTGATGSIGSRLAQRLSDSGQHVIALVRDPSHLGYLKEPGNIVIVRGDLSDAASLRGCTDGCSVVYHCAAKLGGSDWARYRAVNVGGTKALLKEAQRAGVDRFVHVSTIGVYGCSEATDINEDFPWPEERYPYFTTKRDAERAAWDAAGSVPLTVARLGDVFGPGQYIWTINLIERINQGLLHPPTSAESGIFNPVYIENALDALILMGEHPAALGQAFNIVDGRPILFSDYIRQLTQMAGKPIFALPGFILKTGTVLIMALDLLRGREASTRPSDLDYVFHKGTISGQKIRALLEWKPSVSWEDGLCKTEEWLRKEGYIS